MTLTSVIPALAAAAALLAGLVLATCDPTRLRGAWVVPASASLLFAAFSAVAVALEGPVGFWPVHTANLWGNQVWIDLLIAALVGFASLAPTARTLRMRPLSWLLLTLATGSIGLLAMAARVLFLRERAAGSR